MCVWINPSYDYEVMKCAEVMLTRRLEVLHRSSSRRRSAQLLLWTGSSERESSCRSSSMDFTMSSREPTRQDQRLRGWDACRHITYRSWPPADTSHTPVVTVSPSDKQTELSVSLASLNYCCSLGQSLMKYPRNIVFTFLKHKPIKPMRASDPPIFL